MKLHYLPFVAALVFLAVALQARVGVNNVRDRLEGLDDNLARVSERLRASSHRLETLGQDNGQVPPQLQPTGLEEKVQENLRAAHGELLYARVRLQQLIDTQPEQPRHLEQLRFINAQIEAYERREVLNK